MAFQPEWIGNFSIEKSPHICLSFELANEMLLSLQWMYDSDRTVRKRKKNSSLPDKDGLDAFQSTWNEKKDAINFHEIIKASPEITWKLLKIDHLAAFIGEKIVFAKKTISRKEME